MRNHESQLLLLTAALLVGVGTLLVFDVSAPASIEIIHSHDPYYVIKHQLLTVVFGAVALSLGVLIPIVWYQKIPRLIYFVGLGVLLLPIIFPDASHGAMRWIRIFGFSFQTSELTKFCLIIFFAHLVQKTQNEWIFLAWLIPPMLLMMWQRDLGTLVVMGASCLAIYFLASPSWTSIFKVVGLVLLSFLVLIMSASYRRERIMTFFRGFINNSQTQNESVRAAIDDFHVRRLRLAIGRGQVFGQGIGQSQQKTRIPEVHTDSIFAIFAEETGFLGVTVLLGLFGFFLFLLARIASLDALAREQQLIAYGILVCFATQIIINLGAISELLPLTGITLPFISYGGSSLIASLFLTGVGINLGMSEPVTTRQSLTRRRYA
ncbi:FtsW/RodA/SpoVE family cell cycle protein [bacterium]|nr:FtsW/RodA/SpoVE family cell cycle protein [bacterium]